MSGDRKAAPRSVGSQFAELFGSQRIELMRGEARLKRYWHQIVGPMLAERSRPDSLELLVDGGCCLWIVVDHPYLAQQIRLMRDGLRQSCLRHCGIRRLAKIRCRVDPHVVGHVSGAGTEGATEDRAEWHLCRQAVAEMRAVRDRALRHAMVRARLRQMLWEMQGDGDAG